ncbi:FeoB-associated Cys-rich membrane protein [Clostridium sp. SHJSY1]|nr:FeoB-associated Cys-rich membrane protein [Clostridium sp. SHJSY1]MDS0524735.1 FeoB-associated Cys-rich membrane protein [Clostridium sp. SHJSY1]
MEILITGVIIVAAIFIISKNIKSSSKGKCNCSDCSKKCSSRKV